MDGTSFSELGAEVGETIDIGKDMDQGDMDTDKDMETATDVDTNSNPNTITDMNLSISMSMNMKLFLISGIGSLQYWVGTIWNIFKCCARFQSNIGI
jgi:hypothetical protein